MPSFGFSSPSFSSPPARESLPFGESMGESTSSTPSSVKLSCSSPSGRSMHSFYLRNSVAYIETHSLPLEGSIEATDGFREEHVPAVVKTALPDHVASAMQRYPALELLCVDTDSHRPTAAEPDHIYKIPHLCLYSKKDVFLLELGYRAVPGSSQVEGIVLSVTEPFDQVLLGSSTTIDIIRIRQAPQEHQGFGILSPPQAMAMLIYDRSHNEYALHLYHSKGKSLSSPFSYGMEDLQEQLEKITDFCFCQSGAFPLLSALSVAFLKASGDVLQASPVLFRGTAAPRDTVIKTLQYLSSKLEHHENTTARGRQLRVAKQYVMDCFPDDNARGHFLTAKERSVAFEWKAQMQGPVLFPPELDEATTFATAIEPMGVGDLAGFAIGHVGYKLEFSIISPTLFVPRFQLEALEDTSQLDKDLKWGSTVSRVDLRDDETDREAKCDTLALLRDPILETVIHYVTPDRVQSISTNTLQIIANQLQQESTKAAGALFSPPSKRTDMKPRTTGWSCLDVSSNTTTPTKVVGAIVSSDVQLGHVLVARLADGSMCPINITEARNLQEMEDATENRQLALEADSSSTSHELAALKETPPLIDVARPLMQQITEGIRGMGKIVGSATLPEKITPDILAGALDVKQACDEKVMLPLIELNEHVNIRRKQIATMYNDQVSQIKEVRANLIKIKERQASIKEKVEIVNANAQSLTQRSGSALQSAGDLMPTITQSEHDYFQELRRLQEKAEQWEATLQRLKLRSSTLMDSVKEGTAGGHLVLEPASIDQLNALMKGTEPNMRKYSEKLKDLDERVEELEAIAGIERDPHGPVGLRQ